MRWINNIQARWGLPYAYRLGKGSEYSEYSEYAGHDEPCSNDAQQLQGKVTLSQIARLPESEKKKALSFSCILEN